MKYDELRALFHSFVLQVDNTLQTFIMSHDTRVLNTQPEQTYPQLQLDVPSWLPEIGSGIKFKKTLTIEAAIIAPAGTDDWPEQDRVMDALEIEMERLLSYLETQRRLKKLGNITSIGTVTAIEFAEHAALFGWAVEISFKVNMPCYYNDTNTYQIVHLTPSFQSPDTQLSISIGGTQYDASWDDAAIPVDRPLGELVTAINADTGTHNVTAKAYLHSLVLTINSVNTSIPWAAESGGHTWTSITF